MHNVAPSAILSQEGESPLIWHPYKKPGLREEAFINSTGGQAHLYLRCGDVPSSVTATALASEAGWPSKLHLWVILSPLALQGELDLIFKLE